MHTTLELDQQLNTLIAAGKSIEALKTMYAEDVVAQENDDAERVGRSKWIDSREAIEKNITKFVARVLSHAANGDMSYSEWEYNVDIAGMGPMKIVQMSVRKWKNGKVVRERFYHK